MIWRRFLLGLALAFFVCSWFLLLPAPAVWFWITAILLGEWGHIAAIVAFVFAILAWRGTKIAALLFLASGLICLTPLFRAATIARDLPQQCTAAFGPAKGQLLRTNPLDFMDLFGGISTDEVVVTEHTYTSGPKLTLDLYRREGAIEPQPLIVMIHGGSWSRGSKAELRGTNRILARSGYTVAAINYRLAPRWPFPAAVDDVFRALEFLKANAGEFRIDASRIVLMGRSAGGQLALSAAYAGREPAIRGVVAYYPPTDLVRGYENPSARLVLDSKRVLENYLGGSPAEKPAEYAAASPVNHVGPASPPTLLIHGRLDPVVWSEHSAELNARLNDAGVTHFYLSLGWATHGCDANPSGPSGQLSLYAVGRFLSAVTR